MSLHYVYLLIDPRNDTIFYVGQGVGTRAADHMQEALNWAAQGRPQLPALGTKTPEERQKKLQRILDIVAIDPSQPPYVEFLRADLSKTQDDLVETVAIDLIGLKFLTNQVHGPMGGRRMRASLFEILAKSKTKTLSRPAVVVPTVGVRGSFDKHGGMLEADPDTALSNAQTLWNVAPGIRALLSARGATDSPVLLIGIQAGKSLPRAKGLVMGIWEIESCKYDGPKLSHRKADNSTYETDGYKFVVRSELSENLVLLRKELMWNRLIDAAGDSVQTQLGPVYKNKDW